MAGPNVDISVRIVVLNTQRQFLGGPVDIVLTPQAPGQTVNVKAADASKAIDVAGLVRGVRYQVTVTPVNAPKPAPQIVDIPPTGFNTVQFIVDVPIVGPGQYTLKGNLVFDNGLPAAGTREIPIFADISKGVRQPAPSPVHWESRNLT